MHKVAEPGSGRTTVSAQRTLGVGRTTERGEYGEVGRGRPVGGEDGEKGKEELVWR